MDKAILSASHITKVFPGIEVPILRDVSLEIMPKERVAIVGRSGSGKSTLLNILAGLEPTTTGEIYLLGTPFSTQSSNARATARNQYLGFVFQFHHLLAEFTAVENVAFPLWIRGVGQTEAKAKATQVLAQMGLNTRLEHYPSQLSGGERQRVAIARALITKPKCILADEPTGNLDDDTATAIIQILFELCHQNGTSLIMVTHDQHIAKQCDRTLLLDHGQFVLA